MSKFKVGDRVRDPFWREDRFLRISRIDGHTTWLEAPDGSAFPYIIKDDWILQTPSSPISTVTRREIVPGEYGPVATVSFATAEDARCAARIFNEIADVLDENNKDVAA